jgi:ketosteroid isomerase-like protein
MERGSAQFSDGEIVTVDVIEENSTAELAYIVRVERAKAKVGGSDEVTPIALRVTMIFRSEDGTWKVVHRHADTVVTRQPAQSIIE